ncbi:MAG: hypothetical protein ACE5HO_17240 [bacterium]
MTALASSQIFFWLVGLAIILTGVFSITLLVMFVREWKAGNLW